MCLNRRYTKRRKEEWLKNQPEMITAYKAVDVKNKDGQVKFYPIVYGYKPYKRKNRLRKHKKNDWYKRTPVCYDTTCQSRSSYIAYFHLYVDKESAQRWLRHSIVSRSIIKCLIPKRFVTEIGIEGANDVVVIVTKGFDIVEQDRHFQEN